MDADVSMNRDADAGGDASLLSSGCAALVVQNAGAGRVARNGGR